ncbi:MAG: OprO/OprP family phosphate-selective porin [Gammaproteobacteria bacterium]|nr:OprO/OprP family phosphate-selective porin [Gammaproteobacteria bacterium]
MKLGRLSVGLCGLVASSALLAATPSMDEMWRIIQQQQQMIGQQAAEISALKAQNQQIEEQVEATSIVVEETGQRVTNAASWAENTQIGGYGELHYNHFDDKDDQMDFHRFVLFLSHRFNDRLRFFSELELEHAESGEGKAGEVELEQAYLDFDLTDHTTARAGLFLLPVGILNETHEPDTFFGVERNPIEKNIIPTTWWESGVGLNGEFAPGWRYDLAVTSGLNLDPANFSIRSARQKSSKATAENFAYTGRLKWTGIPGLELAATLHHEDDLFQGNPLADDGAATLYETHVVWNQGPFALRALYAMWDLDSNLAAAAGKDQQDGWYLEPSYRLDDRWGFFARYNEWDNGGLGDTEIEQIDFGVNFWPHENVVIKADIQSQDGATDDDGFNLGVGYQF